MNDINKTSSQQSCTLRYNPNHIDVDPAEITVQSTNYLSFAGASYYTNIPSTSVDSIRELVQFFHEIWNHASVKIMCLIITNKLILNLPPELTVKAIRKYHPQCKACATGNLEQRPLLSLPFDRDVAFGEEWECDISGPQTDKKKKKCPSFSGQLYGFLAKCLGSKKRIGFLLRNKGYLLRYLKHLVLLTNQRNRVVKIFRLDAELVTEEITQYCMEKRILILPCIPHEHATLGNVERDNRTLREIILKTLAGKPHLDERYWGMCYQDAIFKMNIMPCSDDPTTTPYERWYGRKFDLLKQPMLDFGCIVMAHVPLTQQGNLSDKAVETYYVGCHADGRHGGILLYNPKTKHTIIRRSFRVLAP